MILNNRGVIQHFEAGKCGLFLSNFVYYEETTYLSWINEIEQIGFGEVEFE